MSAASDEYFGVLESHDHEGVNSSLKRVAEARGLTIQPGLNAEFTDRLNKRKAVPKEQFDAYYVNDTKQISPARRQCW